MKFTEFANIPTLDSKKIIADLKDTKAGTIGVPLRDLEEWMLVIAENYDEALKDKIHSPLVGWLKQTDKSYALSFKNGKWNLTEFKKDFSAKVIAESEELVDVELRAKKILKNFPSIPLQLEDALKKANIFEGVKRTLKKNLKEDTQENANNYKVGTRIKYSSSRLGSSGEGKIYDREVYDTDDNGNDVYDYYVITKDGSDIVLTIDELSLYGSDITPDKTTKDISPRTIRAIAKDIRADWKNISSSYAWPYYQAMADINSISDMYGADDAYGIVLYFLSNSAGWKGEKAREIKAELKKMCKDYEKSKNIKESMINEAIIDDHIYTIHDFEFTEISPGVYKLKKPKASGGPKQIMSYFFSHVEKDSRIEGIYDLKAYRTPWELVNGKVVNKEPVFTPTERLRLTWRDSGKTGYLIHAPSSTIDEVKKIFSYAINKQEKSLEDAIERKENQKKRAADMKKFDYERRKNDQKELEAKYGKDVISRVKIRKYMGDDLYSWAVFVDGRPIITGLSQHSAHFEKIQAYKRLSKNTATRVTEEKTKDIKIADISKVYPLKRDGFIYGLDDEKFIVYTHSTPRGKPIFSIFKQWTKYVVRVLNRKEVRLDTLSEVLSYLNKQKIDKIVDKVPTDQSILKFLNKWVELPKNVKLTLDNIKELSFKPVDGGKVIEITHPDYDDYDEYFVFGEGEEEPTQKARYVVIGISEVGLTVDDLTKWLIKNKAKAIKK